ncbi:MAG: B12-binding domain-containing radical SAM protein [Myxococcales bacterium]|nr:B12-binding domain-containing radical SAM protein [Myxococcales bacterium]
MRPDPMKTAPALPPPRRGRPVPRTALLLNPFYAKESRQSFGKHVLTPSLALTSIAGATPPGWTVRYWDENLLQGPPPAEPLPEVVGISVHLTFAARAYELAAWFRAMGCTVVLGGLHSLSCPEELQQHADAVAVGNGVDAWPRILRDIERGELRPRYVGEYGSYSDEPPPDRSILPQSGFLTAASLIATRGCHNRCDFCYLATLQARPRYEMRRPEAVAQELAATGAPYAVFIDNNLGSSRRYLGELCRALAPLEKIWSAAVTLDVTDEPELVREMALAGCSGVFVGFESLEDENLRAAGKRGPKSEEFARRVEVFHRFGIQVNGSFVLGFDHDRPDCFERLANWIEEVRLECATFHILTPYPGTPLFGRLEEEGRILHREWSLYDTAHCVFRPRHLSPEELEAGHAWLYRRLFSLRSIWARRPAQPAAVPAYLAMSLLYKRSNWLWRLLIQHRLTHAVWAPLVHLSRWRHLRLRAKLARAPLALGVPVAVPPGI